MEFKWEDKKLSEIGYIVTGKTPSTKIEKNFGDRVPFLTPSDDMDARYVYETKRYLSDEGVNEVRKKLIPKNSICISCIGSQLGKVTITTEETVTNQQINSIVINDEYNIHFIYYLLLILGQKLNFLSKSSTAVPIINKKFFSEISVKVPQRQLQDKIAILLDSLDSKIEINNKIISNLESQAQAIFKSWFVDFEPFQDGGFVESELGMIPEGWEVKELGEVADFSNGYSFKSKDLLEEKKSKNDYKVFKQADIKVGGGINPNNTKSWIDSEFIRKNKLSRFIIQSGDLMMCMTDMKNNVRLLGNTALVYQPDEYILNQRVGRLRSKQKEIKPSFLYYLTNNSVFLNDLRGRANTGVQVNLSTSEIKRSKVVLPTCDIIKRFCDYSESITKSINSLNNQNTKLAELRDALLPKLMAGEIDVSNIKIEGEEVKNE